MKRYGKVSLRLRQVHCSAGQNLKEEEDHLMKAFVGNGYPWSLIRSASATKPPRERDGEREEERTPTVHLPYVAGVSERIRRVCRDFNIRTVFKSRPTLCSLLTKVKDLHAQCQSISNDAHRLAST